MSDTPPRRKGPVSRSNEQGPPIWIPCVFLAVLIGVMIWIGNWFIQFNELQDCISAGHHDCGPPIEPGK